MGEPATTPADIAPSHVRFGVLGFACSLSLLTYLDRICIMRVQEEIQQDLGLSQVQMGLVFAAFAVGYMVFEVPGGWMGDRMPASPSHKTGEHGTGLRRNRGRQKSEVRRPRTTVGQLPSDFSPLPSDC